MLLLLLLQVGLESVPAALYSGTETKRTQKTGKNKPSSGMQLIGSFSSRKCRPIRGKAFLGRVLIWAVVPRRGKKKSERGGEVFRESRSFSIPLQNGSSLGMLGIQQPKGAGLSGPKSIGFRSPRPFGLAAPKMLELAVQNHRIEQPRKHWTW